MLHLKGREIREQDVTLNNLFQGLTPDGKNVSFVKSGFGVIPI